MIFTCVRTPPAHFSYLTRTKLKDVHVCNEEFSDWYTITFLGNEKVEIVSCNFDVWLVCDFSVGSG